MSNSKDDEAGTASAIDIKSPDAAKATLTKTSEAEVGGENEV